MTQITPVPWYLIRPHSRVMSTRDGQLYTVLNVDITQLPHVVTTLGPSGAIVIRTVDPWEQAYVVHPSDVNEALVNVAHHFVIEKVTVINER